MIDFKPTSYSLMNVATSRMFQDSGWVLADPESPVPSLVRAVYDKKTLDVRSDNWGFYRFADWLPIRRILKNSATTVTYRSEKLAKQLGLENLYISFSGYWPEKGAMMRTCSFKETEAYSVCGRLPEDNKRILVVASAGNTARAFAQVCSDNDIPLLLCVPEDNIDVLWFSSPIKDCVKLICPPKGCDYFDAIALSQIACTDSRFMDEGGAKNVARRDGMGTTVLSAAVAIGETPDCYFQAVGSGTGTIAAWESNMRLNRDGRFGNKKMRLHAIQNRPFTPMYDAWMADSRNILPMNDDEARHNAGLVDAKVLTNRKPPYSIAGGLYDALKDSKGYMDSVTNEELRKSAQMFCELEGCDIYSASAVALCGLEKAVKAGTVSPKEIVMLNITGGGEMRAKSQNRIFNLKPSAIVSPADKDKVIKEIEKLF